MRVLAVPVLLTLLLAAAKVPAPTPDEIPGLAEALAAKLDARTLAAPDGSQVKAGTILNRERTERSLKTIGEAEAWPSAWLIVQDMTQPHDLIVKVTRGADGTIADPDPVFLAARREWDDAALEGAVRQATGAKPSGRTVNIVVQSFTKSVATTYVYDLPKTGTDAKGLLALLPEGSLLREAAAVDLGDGRQHTLAVVLERPRFVPGNCTTERGRSAGHRDEGGIVLVLAGEAALEDRLEITEIVRKASGTTSLPRFACRAGDDDPGAIDRLVDAKFEGREPVRLLNLRGKLAQSPLGDTPVVVGIKEDNGVFKLFASPETR